jgi:hypothetical protein
MSFSGCEEFLWWFSEKQAQDPLFRARLLEAMAANDGFDAVAVLISETEAAAADIVTTEIEQLPAAAVRTMLTAWREASEQNLKFRARSVLPDRPLEFARNRRVRVVVDRNQDSMEVQLSHIPTRHPIVGDRSDVPAH